MKHTACQECDLVPLAMHLLQLQDEAIHLHKQAYGADSIKPKHHRLYHVILRMLRELDLLLDTLIIEREHLGTKKIADVLKNTSISEAIVKHLQSKSCRMQ